MREEPNIEIQAGHTEEVSVVQLPINYMGVGEIDNDDIKVYIRQDVYKALEKYSQADIEHERGTIILGEYCEEMGKMHVIISAFIEAKYTDASTSTLTFTHETWDYVHREKEAKHPDKKIIGWQHTHPSYGIFLSNYDLFIQENFFNLPFQVAYVIDPIQNLRGFFQWKSGRIERLKGYYIYDNIGNPIKISQVKTEKKITESTSRRLTSRGAVFAVAIALLMVIVCLFMLWNLNKQIDKYKEYQNELEALVLHQNQIVGELNAEIERLQLNGITTDEKYILYTIKSGDTLEGICQSLNIDYWKNKNAIMALNRIENGDIIFAGQTLIFPRSIQNN